jgi:phospholipase C
VIVIIGENRTFDHVFATYQPKHEQLVWNLLSEGIVNADGSPGPRFDRALQRTAVDHGTYSPSPGSKAPYRTLPPPLSGGPTQPYIATVAEADQAENGLAPGYDVFLTTGGTGLPSRVPDTRIANVNALPPGPFQLTPGVPYDAYAASPVHRFYQMWQQLDCDAERATYNDPSGCRSDLFPWVEVTVGAGANGKPQPANFTDATTGEGSTSMGFYNVQQGDAPYLKELADTYAMSDNFHQSVQGGTGANHVMLGTGDAIWFSDGRGRAMVPSALETENPDPQPGTNNWYTQDGYSGGTYSTCADDQAPGVGPVRDYLDAVGVDPNCEDGHAYLLNNYAPGYFGDGSVNSDPFAIPPSTLRTIGDELSEERLSWRYYGDQFDRYLADPTYANPLNNYCDICNPFQYATSIMTDAAERTEHLKDTIDLYDDVARGFLPAVSFVKPSGLVDGHPASSKLDLFEGFVRKIVDQVKGQPELWEHTAIIVTFDEGGGYYDSGYVQPLDFFGDGTRIPLLVVSPHATGGRISHRYADHVSVLKFIERNWSLPPVTARSRDNLPNPEATRENPWVPRNGPSIDDLFDLFDFAHEER